MPAAIAIITTGTNSAIPPTKTKQTISTGNARPIKIDATIFAAPQVNLNARPMDFTSSQIKIAMVSNSNISFPFKTYSCVSLQIRCARYLFFRIYRKTRFRIYTDRRNISLISGHKKENKLKLGELGYSFSITQEDGTDLRIEALP